MLPADGARHTASERHGSAAMTRELTRQTDTFARVQGAASSWASRRLIPSWVSVTIAGVLPGSQSTVTSPSPAR
ncbi:hypothetical protein GCM10017750_34060 [Streptomyces racemochromogenes]